MTDSREKRAHFLFLWLRQGIVAQRGIKGLFKAVKAVFKPGYAEEKARRKRESAARRREYKTEKQRQYRAVSGIMAVTAETMRREHDLAALELSREIYH